MDVTHLHGLCYSATGGTEKVVRCLLEALEKELGLPGVFQGFTKPGERSQEHPFAPGDLVVIGSPTYAGRMPNKIAPDYRARLRGNGALAIPVVTFGNRAYDNALAELRALLEDVGFHTLAAGAFPIRHAFTDALGGGRPDWDDRRVLEAFAKDIAGKLHKLEAPPPPVEVPGDPEAPYYIPLGTDGQPAKFLKAKPQTDLGKCSHCGVCARLCPMGAIDPQQIEKVPGTCIKCQSCVRRCTRHAKFFDDPAFLSHVAMLEANFQEPKEASLFL